MLHAPVNTPLEEPTKPRHAVSMTANALFTIFPYKYRGQWMFDDKSRDILGEPFVMGKDGVLEQLVWGKSIREER